MIQVQKALPVLREKRAHGVNAANEAPTRMTTTTKQPWHSSEALRVHPDLQAYQDETVFQDTKETPATSVHPARWDHGGWTECPESQASKDPPVYQVTKVHRERRVTRVTSDLPGLWDHQDFPVLQAIQGSKVTKVIEGMALGRCEGGKTTKVWPMNPTEGKWSMVHRVLPELRVQSVIQGSRDLGGTTARRAIEAKRVRRESTDRWDCRVQWGCEAIRVQSVQ